MYLWVALIARWILLSKIRKSMQLNFHDGHRHLQNKPQAANPHMSGSRTAKVLWRSWGNRDEPLVMVVPHERKEMDGLLGL